jgi:transposase
VLPHAKIVVDKFHVVRMANEAMERIRKAHRLTLPTKSRLQLKDDRWILLHNEEDIPAFKRMIMETWFDRFPDLKDGHAAKESFRAIWTATTVDDAKARYDKWEDQLPDSCADAFIDLRIAMRNWREEIFNHFEFRITNAYTEAINGIARIVNRAGRGYSFEVLRAKMLLNHANHKIEHGGGMTMKKPMKLGITLPIAFGIPFWKLTDPRRMKLNQPYILPDWWLLEV